MLSEPPTPQQQCSSLLAEAGEEASRLGWGILAPLLIPTHPQPSTLGGLLLIVRNLPMLLIVFPAKCNDGQEGVSNRYLDVEVCAIINSPLRCLFPPFAATKRISRRSAQLII